MNHSGHTIDSNTLGYDALMEACTPKIYIQNAFRISGLSVDATARDIKRRIDDLKNAEELGHADDEHSHAFALQPPPKIEQIREAANKLQDPQRRIIEEFFWFWPNEWGKGKQDLAILALQNGKKDDAFEIWRKDLSSPDELKSIIAKHNLAVMYHVVAIDSEHIAMESELTKEQIDTISKYWRRCFKWWEELTDDETFWSYFTDRIRMHEDSRLTTGMIRRIRKALPEAFDKINAMLAIKYAELGKLAMVESHIIYMKETHQGIDNIDKTLSEITGPLKSRIRVATQNTLEDAKKQPNKAAEKVRELLHAVAEPIRILKLILPDHDHERIDLCDTVADVCQACQVIYANKTKDWTTSLELLHAALKYAASVETKQSVMESIDAIKNNQIFEKYFEPLVQKLDSIREGSSVSNKLRQVESDLLPRLREIEKQTGTSHEAYEASADMIANFMRGLSVELFNEKDDLPEATRILDWALTIARGSEAKKRLADDKKQLAEIKQQRNQYNVSLAIRSDEVEVTNERVRYNSKVIPVEQIRAIKFGIFIQYTNGIQSSASYLIDVKGSASTGSISIECKRMLRSEEQARTDYGAILDGLLHQVAPTLVQRLARDIVSGTTLEMGPCKITGEGVIIPSGILMWKKDVLIPYRELSHFLHQGQLNITSRADPKLSSSLSLRDVWNAVIFEYIVKAVKELKKR